VTTSLLVSSTRRFFTMAIASVVAVVALMGFAHSAFALKPVDPTTGNGNNNIPPHPQPIAKFTITPNPVVVNGGVIDLGNIGGGAIQPVKAAAVPSVLVRGVKFDASTSYSPSGTMDYEWDLDGNGSYETHTSTPVVYKKYPIAGTYAIGLKIIDGDNSGLTDTAAHNLTVYNAPRAVLAASPALALPGQQVTYSAAGSTGDGGVTKYDWDLDGDGTYETHTSTPAATQSYQSLGERTIRLRVTDSHGTSASASVKETVTRAPSAAFTFAPSPAVINETVKFDGSQSSDDSKVADYAWDLDGNGTFETDTHANPKTTMKYTTVGTVNVRLRVTDDNGLQDIVAHPVQVLAAPPADTKAPVMSISRRSVKMSRKGIVSMRIVCPAGERSCSGRLALTSLLRHARGSSLGGASFQLGGGQSQTVKIHLSRKNQRLVKKLHKLSTQATATAKDAAGNSGISKVRLTIKR
jgi:hypothetical protein